MKITGLIVVWFMALAAPAQSGPTWKICRNPVRVFAGGRTVDLAPLFQWWARQPLVVTNKNADTNSSPVDERPLSAWSRVTGTKVGVAGPSWVLDAVIYTSPTVHTNARVFLNDPPTAEEQSFYALKAELADAEQRIADAQRVYKANTNAEAKAEAAVAKYRRSLSKVASDGVIAYTRLATEKHDAAALALNQIDQLQMAREQVEAQIETIPASDGFYQVDWFAVLLGHTKAGVPIYDLGWVSATPP
jgi:hypothetical protein